MVYIISFRGTTDLSVFCTFSTVEKAQEYFDKHGYDPEYYHIFGVRLDPPEDWS